MEIEKTYSFRQKCLDADTVKKTILFYKTSLSLILSTTMFLIENHQQGHSLKSQDKNLKFA